jgi:hypothetical protein
LFVSSIGIIIWIVQYSLLAKWWKNFIGITLVGEALALFLIYLPSDMALVNPQRFMSFAQTRWYLWLSAGVVVATALFIVTRIFTWESIRRKRGKQVLAGDNHVTELQQPNN